MVLMHATMICAVGDMVPFFLPRRIFDETAPFSTAIRYSTTRTQSPEPGGDVATLPMLANGMFVIGE